MIRPVARFSPKRVSCRIAKSRLDILGWRAGPAEHEGRARGDLRARLRDLHLLRALKEGGHKWNPSVAHL
jgi:hypothetical protein